MAKNIGFNISLAINGQDVVIKCKNGVQNLGKALGTIPSAGVVVSDVQLDRASAIFLWRPFVQIEFYVSHN